MSDRYSYRPIIRHEVRPQRYTWPVNIPGLSDLEAVEKFSGQLSVAFFTVASVLQPPNQFIIWHWLVVALAWPAQLRRLPSGGACFRHTFAFPGYPSPRKNSNFFRLVRRPK